MAEEITLTAAQIVSKTTTAYKVESLLIWPTKQVLVLVIAGTNGERVDFKREGAAAMTLMTQLNTSNNSVTSLQKRVLQWALTQPEATAAVIAGTITGTPD